MANSYTQFSEEIEDITSEEAKWIDEVLRFDYSESEEDGPAIARLARLLGRKKKELGDVDLDCWPGFEWSTKGAEKGTLWLYCEEGFQEGNLVIFIQSFIRKFRPDYVFKMSAACFCDKMRLGEFGGIWLAISKDQVEAGNTWDAAQAALEALKTGNFGPEVDQ